MTLHTDRIATAFVSIDIPQAQEDSQFVTGIYDVLRYHHAPALWSFEFLRAARVLDRIRGSGHEFGLLFRDVWANLEAERTVYGRELSSRLCCARDKQIEPVALAFQSIDAPAHFDLLVKHQIALIRTRTDIVSGSASGLQPRLSRYGIWQAEPAIVLPVTSRWTLPITLRRLLKQAVEKGQTLHVAINGERLAKNMAAGLGAIDYLLKLTTARRDAGELQIVSARQLIDLYAPRREQFKSRSVLRVA